MGEHCQANKTVAEKTSRRQGRARDGRPRSAANDIDELEPERRELEPWRPRSEPERRVSRNSLAVHLAFTRLTRCRLSCSADARLAANRGRRGRLMAVATASVLVTTYMVAVAGGLLPGSITGSTSVTSGDLRNGVSKRLGYHAERHVCVCRSRTRRPAACASPTPWRSQRTRCNFF